MKKLFFLLTITATAALLSGCETATQNQKTITVTKDANGNIVSTVIVETIIQPPTGMTATKPIKFDYIKTEDNDGVPKDAGGHRR